MFAYQKHLFLSAGNVGGTAMAQETGKQGEHPFRRLMHLVCVSHAWEVHHRDLRCPNMQPPGFL